MLGPNECQVCNGKKFGSKRMLGQKKFCLKNIWVGKKILPEENVLSKTFWPKNLSPKKFE